MQNVNQGVFIAISIFALLVIGFALSLFEAKPGEIAAALGAILGGIIGAAGAALAVYLTLRGQREDESISAISAILSEVAELSKFPVGQLGMCAKVQMAEISPPKGALSTIMHTPNPVIYPALASRISRLPKPTLIVSFYTRLHETRGVVEVIATSPPSNGLTGPQHIQGLADILISQCQLARMILTIGGVEAIHETDLARDMRVTMVRRIDEQLAAARQVFPNAESFSPENEIDASRNTGLAAL